MEKLGREKKGEGEGHASLRLMKEKWCCNYRVLPHVWLFHSTDLYSFHPLNSHSLLSLGDKVKIRPCCFFRVDLIEGLADVKVFLQ